MPFEQFELFLSLPGRRGGQAFRANVPNDAGDYPVNSRKLRDIVAPCLVHRLDAFFAGLVVEGLAARGVTDVVALHDCWLVRSEHEHTLGQVIEEIGEPWF